MLKLIEYNNNCPNDKVLIKNIENYIKIWRKKFLLKY